MPYKNFDRQRLVTRGSVRTRNHGNWRQTFIDCGGMYVARVNGDELPCGEKEGLEFHEIWGENGDNDIGKFQQRILLCNLHHALIEDRAHQAEFMLWQYKPSRLTDDVGLEILLAGGYQKWVAKWKLDDSKSDSMLFKGPHVEDYE